jgi:hypothetical protein
MACQILIAAAVGSAQSHPPLTQDFNIRRKDVIFSTNQGRWRINYGLGHILGFVDQGEVKKVMVSCVVVTIYKL